jgi:hypothetical protein
MSEIRRDAIRWIFSLPEQSRDALVDSVKRSLEEIGLKADGTRQEYVAYWEAMYKNYEIIYLEHNNGTTSEQ